MLDKSIFAPQSCNASYFILRKENKMKKLLLSSLAVAGLMMCASSVSAAEPGRAPYVVGEAGYSFGTKNAEDAGILGIGTGYHINEFLRTDVIASYRGWGKLKFKGANDQKSDLWSIPVLANIYATYPVYDGMGVYAMGGIGMAWNKTDSLPDAKGATKTNFAWTAGVGIDYMVNECMSLDLGYRYTDLGQARVKARDGYTGKSKQDVRSNDVKLTARYYF